MITCSYCSNQIPTNLLLLPLDLVLIVHLILLIKKNLMHFLLMYNLSFVCTNLYSWLLISVSWLLFWWLPINLDILNINLSIIYFKWRWVILVLTLNVVQTIVSNINFDLIVKIVFNLLNLTHNVLFVIVLKLYIFFCLFQLSMVIQILLISQPGRGNPWHVLRLLLNWLSLLISRGTFLNELALRIFKHLEFLNHLLKLNNILDLTLSLIGLIFFTLSSWSNSLRLHIVSIITWRKFDDTF